MSNVVYRRIRWRVLVRGRLRVRFFFWFILLVILTTFSIITSILIRTVVRLISKAIIIVTFSSTFAPPFRTSNITYNRDNVCNLYFINVIYLYLFL